MNQQRILTEGPLHTREGLLSETGYAVSPLKTYDRSRIKASKWRIKEWDYYLVMNDAAALALTVADNGYMGLDSISLLDLEQKEQRTATRMVLFPMGKRGLPPASGDGVTRAVGKNYELTFRKERGRRQLYGHMYDFGGAGRPLLFDIELEEKKADSMVIVTPYEKKPKLFYYNRKINCMPAEGRVIFAHREYLFSPSASFGVLDWGRGVWPYCGTWYWGSASGVIGGKAFGMNLGYGFGDLSRATENMLFYEGIAHKLAGVTFDVPGKGSNEDDPGGWRVRDDAGRLDLQFEPLLDRSSHIDFLLLASLQHQVFGRFTGTAVLDDGRKLDVKGLTGFLEKVSNRW